MILKPEAASTIHAASGVVQSESGVGDAQHDHQRDDQRREPPGRRASASCPQQVKESRRTPWMSDGDALMLALAGAGREFAHHLAMRVYRHHDAEAGQQVTADVPPY